MNDPINQDGPCRTMIEFVGEAFNVNLIAEARQSTSLVMELSFFKTATGS
jgi:riboflavin synthase alpha subunit